VRQRARFETAGHNNVRPLAGLRVLDLTRVLSGPYCTAMLVKNGADVIKIEPPAGDDYRHIGPFLQDGQSALFEKVNGGKRSIALDLAKPEDLRVALALVVEADVLVENFRPGVAAKLGIGFEALKILNSKLIYASISGFGQTGEMAKRPAYDIVVQAMSGIISVTGQPGGPPTLIGESIGDVTAGLFAYNAIMTALYQRHTTGFGQHLDISMLESMLQLQPLIAARLQATGKTPTRVGNRHALSAPFGMFEASDASFVLAVLNDKLFKTMTDVIGQPELFTNPLYATDPLRLEHERSLRIAIESWSSKLTAAHVVTKLVAAGIPASEVLDAKQAQSLARLKERLAPAPKLDEHGSHIRKNLWKNS
jgi:CoA:oxalate CoA-transferase